MICDSCYPPNSCNLIVYCTLLSCDLVINIAMQCSSSPLHGHVPSIRWLKGIFSMFFSKLRDVYDLKVMYSLFKEAKF